MSRERHVIGAIVTALAAACLVTVPVQSAPPPSRPATALSDADTLVLQPGGEAVDAYVDSWYPTQNFGDLTWFRSIGLPYGEALLRFDLSTIPFGSTIVSAQIELWAEFRAGTISFAPVSSTWDESTVTWNTKPGTTLPVVTHPMDTCSFGCIQSFEITDIVSYAIAHPQSDFGFKITANSGSVGWLMGSSDHATPSYRPRLTVQYVPGAVPVEAGLWGRMKAIYR